MATNTILTDAVIAKESMMVFHNNCAFVKGVNRQYSKEFAVTGAKIGQTINVKKANRYSVQQGPTITPQGTTEDTVPLTLNRWWTVPMVFNDAERTLAIDNFKKNYIDPAVSKTTSTVDWECMYAAVNGVYPTANAAGSYACPGAGPVYNQVGTPGTTPGTAGGSASALLQYNAPAVYLNAGLLLSNFAAPNDGRRTCLLGTAAHAASVGSLSGLFNPQNIISTQYKKGKMGNALTFDFIEDQNIASYTNSTGLTLGDVTLVDETATCSSTSATSGGIFQPGFTFTVAGVYAVNPENQQPTGLLQPFVVTEQNTASSTTVTGLKISPTPKLVGTGIADGNCYVVAGSFSALASTTLLGTVASTVYPINMAYHEDAFTLGTADLELPNNAGGGSIQYAARENYEGISMRIVTFWDGISSSNITRLDILGGFSVQRPEWAVKIVG